MWSLGWSHGAEEEHATGPWAAQMSCVFFLAKLQHANEDTNHSSQAKLPTRGLPFKKCLCRSLRESCEEQSWRKSNRIQHDLQELIGFRDLVSRGCLGFMLNTRQILGEQRDVWSLGWSHSAAGQRAAVPSWGRFNGVGTPQTVTRWKLACRSWLGSCWDSVSRDRLGSMLSTCHGHQLCQQGDVKTGLKPRRRRRARHRAMVSTTRGAHQEEQAQIKSNTIKLEVLELIGFMLGPGVSGLTGFHVKYSPAMGATVAARGCKTWAGATTPNEKMPQCYSEHNWNSTMGWEHKESETVTRWKLACWSWWNSCWDLDIPPVGPVPMASIKHRPQPGPKTPSHYMNPIRSGTPTFIVLLFVVFPPHWIYPSWALRRAVLRHCGFSPGLTFPCGPVVPMAST